MQRIWAEVNCIERKGITNILMWLDSFSAVSFLCQNKLALFSCLSRTKTSIGCNL